MPSGSGEGDFQRFLLFKPWRPSSLCDLDHFICFCSQIRRKLHMTFGFDWPKQMFEYYANIHVNSAGTGTEYYGNINEHCPGVKVDLPLGSIFFRIINVHFHKVFSLQMTF